MAPPKAEPPIFRETDQRFVLWMLLLVPAGGVLSGWPVYSLAPEAEGHGADAAIDAHYNHRGFELFVEDENKTIAVPRIAHDRKKSRPRVKRKVKMKNTCRAVQPRVPEV